MMKPLKRLRHYLANRLRRLEDRADEILFLLDNEEREQRRERLNNSLRYIYGQTQALQAEYHVICKLIEKEEKRASADAQKRKAAWLETLIGKAYRG